MTIPVFPTAELAPRQQRIALIQSVTFGGVSVGGAQGATANLGGGLWMFEFSEVNLNKAPKLKAWRAFEGLMDGGAGRVIVPICDCRQAPEGAGVVDGIPHSDGSFFSDDSGYSQSTLEASAGAAALRATTITTELETAALIEGGEHFSIDHATKGRRMYRVIAVDRETGDLTIRPPLREAIEEGAPLDFNAPSCTMRLVNGDAMAPTVEMGRFASGAVVFIEAF